MTVMQPPAGPARDDSAGDERAAADSPAFVPLACTDGRGWVPIAAPQAAARTACRNATAHIHILNRALVLRDLDIGAQGAISALENGAASVTIDERHRVDRTDTAPAAGRHATP
jgi:hypothetical protein